MPRHLLITGASGRLGSALTVALGAQHRVTQLSLVEPADAAQRALGPLFTGSVTDAALIEAAMDGVDAVIHCASFPGAAEPFAALMHTNVLGTFTVLEAAGKRASVRQVIYASSIAWYGLHESWGGQHRPLYLPIDEDHPSLASGYHDTSKVLAERLCESYAHRFQKPCVAMRPAWIVDADLERRFSAAPPVDRPHLNDYVGISDLIDAVFRLLDYEPEDGFEAMHFHAADQRTAMPTLDLARRVYPGVALREEKLADYAALVDCERARTRLGWSPSYRCWRDAALAK